MRYRLQRHDGTDCSATMVPITVLRMVPIQRYRHHSMKANKRDRIVKVRLTNLEYEELTKASKSSKCMSDYFRQRVFRKGVGLIDPKEFIRSMDEICLEMKRIGNNINQLARYVNIHKEEVNQEVLNEVEKKMADYVIMQDKLNVTWRKLMSIK